MERIKVRTTPISTSTSIQRVGLTLDIPNPPLTPKPRNNHHKPAPPIPAAPVPLDHAPNAVREAAREGYVVVIWRKVSSPRPDERDARDIPNRRGGTEEENAIVYS
jgi:hypothetical protein